MGKRPVLAIAVTTVVVLQFAVPLTALVLSDKPNRLGWQMFSGVGEHEVVVRTADGEAVDVPWEEVLPKARRPELDWTRHLPEHLCALLGEQELTIEQGSAVRRVTC